MGELKYRKIPTRNEIDPKAFEHILKGAKPVVLKNCDFGQCMTKWNLAYLSEKIADHIVTHESSLRDSELAKCYINSKTCKFSEFSNTLTSSKSYFTSAHRTAKKIAKPPRIEDDFPALSDDLKLPSFIPLGKDNELYHSSVLHVTAKDVQVWTHYDIYDNILCQVVGMQRVILFKPSETKYIYMDEENVEGGEYHGFSSCCTEYRSALRDAKPSFCYLEPGDCLFIPKFWRQNIRAVKSQSLDPDFGSGGDRKKSATDSFPGYSIAFNIFFRDQQLVAESQYPDDDVHNDKQLKPYELALEHANIALNLMDKLPKKSKKMYQYRMWRHMKKRLNVVELEKYDDIDFD